MKAIKPKVTKPVVVVGLDPSLTGFGVCEYAVGRAHATQRWAPKGMTDIERLAHFYERVHALLVWSKPRAVAIEGYAFDAGKGKSRAHSLGELGGVVRLALRNYSVVQHHPPKVLVVPPTVLKKFVTDNGNAPKELMLLKTYKVWGAEFTNSDECDAYGLSRLAAAIVGAEQPRLAYQREVVAKIQA